MPPSTRSPQPAKALLALRGLKQSDVARDLGVNAHWLGRVLNGREHASPELAQRLAVILSVDVSELFADEHDDVVVQLVRRTTTACGVPELVEGATAETVGALLGEAL